MTIGLDTSVAVPLLVRAHTAHDEVVRWWAGRPLALTGHALVETYSVLTRLPSGLRAAPDDAARLLEERFADPLLLDDATSRDVPHLLADAGVAGGAVYDALVGLAAARHGVPLATRDRRAVATYRAVGAEVVVAG